MAWRQKPKQLLCPPGEAGGGGPVFRKPCTNCVNRLKCAETTSVCWRRRCHSAVCKLNLISQHVRHIMDYNVCLYLCKNRTCADLVRFISPFMKTFLLLLLEYTTVPIVGLNAKLCCPVPLRRIRPTGFLSDGISTHCRHIPSRPHLNVNKPCRGGVWSPRRSRCKALLLCSLMSQSQWISGVVNCHLEGCSCKAELWLLFFHLARIRTPEERFSTWLWIIY